MSTKQFACELEEDTDYPLQDTGFSFNIARIQEGALQTVEQLKQMIQLGGPKKIIVVPRKDVHPNFLQVVDNESRTGADCVEERYMKWNGADGVSASNAMPHMHPNINCHISTLPTDTGTAFFRPHDFLAAVREASEQTQWHPSVRSHIQYALTISEENPCVEPNVFQALHTISTQLNNLEHNFAALQCIASIQESIRARCGQFDVNLGADGNALVVIPKFCLHGRSLANDLVRSSFTAWRYFQSE